MFRCLKAPFVLTICLAVLTPSRIVSQEKETQPGGDEAVRKALQQPTELSFKRTSLNNVLEFLSEKHKIPILINRRALEDAGIVPEDTLVTHSLKGVKLEAALAQLLTELGLAWIIRDEVLMVTSKDDADQFLTTQFYPVADLVKRDKTEGPPADDSNHLASLMELLEGAVQPDSWSDAGGPASMSVLRHTLIVSQDASGHREIVALLKALRYARRQQSEAKGAARLAVVKPYDSQAENQIESVLRRRVKLDFAGTALSDVAHWLSKQHDLPIRFNRRALEDAGIVAEEQKINFKAGNISLFSGLKLLLEEFGLSWIIKDDVLMITSRDDADQFLVLRMYPIKDLMGDKESDDELYWLMDLIRDTVRPDSWDDVGGPGSFLPMMSVGCLAISQTQHVHERIETFLPQVRKFFPARRTGPRKTTDDNAKISLKVYYLIPTTEDDKVDAKLMEGVVQLVKEIVAPESWETKDGSAVIRALPDRLVVHHTGKAHREIRQLLEDLDVLSPFSPHGESRAIPR